jgi:hypothetical protein
MARGGWEQTQRCDSIVANAERFGDNERQSFIGEVESVLTEREIRVTSPWRVNRLFILRPLRARQKRLLSLFRVNDDGT